MAWFAEKFIENCILFAQRENQKLPSNLTKEEVYDTLSQRAFSNRHLMHENNDILDKFISPFLEDPLNATIEEAEIFADLAKRLFSLDQNVDIGVAYPLHSALLARARALNDIDNIIIHLYWSGLITLRWSANLFREDSISIYKEAVSFKDQYFNFKTKEARLAFCKCMGNRYVSLSGLRRLTTDYSEFYAAIDAAVEFWNREDVRAFDPEFPWAGFILNSNQSMSSYIDQLRNGHNDTPELARRVYNSVVEVYGHNDDIIDVHLRIWTNSRTLYLILASKYHVGELTIKELVDSLKNIFESTKPDDYSFDGLYRMLFLSRVYLIYLEKDEISKEDYMAENRRVLNIVFKYCDGLPHDVDRFLVNNYLTALSASSLIGEDAREYTGIILRYTTFSHLPTYVHSLVVGNIMSVLVDYYIDHAPYLLVGILDTKSVEEVLEKRTQILEEARYVGLAHDTGKIAYINTVSLCSRKITSHEFDIIKNHADAGSGFFIKCTDRPWLSDVIAGHHKWYDGSRGYPDSFSNTASLYKTFIDICSVADSIDAATDTIGRSYAPGRNLEFVINEVKETAGTRYCPIAAEALSDPAVVEKIRSEITQGRVDAYFQAYRYMDSNGKTPEISDFIS